MTTKRQRGTAFQLWCKKWLEEFFPGVVVHNQPMNHFRLPGGVWACRANDILGCADLVAIHPDQPPLFIQVSLDEHVEKRLGAFAAVPWNLVHTTVQLWIKRPNGVVVIKQLGRDEKGYYLKDQGEIVRRKYERL